MDNGGAAKRLTELIEIIRPALPRQADYSVQYKAALYDRARAVLYDDAGQLRPLPL